MLNILELKDVYYTAGDTKILSDINLSVAEGEFLTITGPSGSGKSTMLKLIASLIGRTKGSITYNGKDQYTYNPTDYRKAVSYCYQSPNLFGNTVRDNLSFPYDIRNMEFDEKRAIDLLEFVGLPADFLDKKVGEMSGGQTQRVAMLRNVMFVPRVLLLDEVTTGLDDLSRSYVNKLINQMHEEHGVTVLSITHNDAEVKSAKNLLTIVDGEIGANHESN